MTLPLRTVGLIGAVCVTVGWLLASILTPPVARVQTLPERQPRPAAPAQDTGFTEQLHFRLQNPPQPPAPGRNPFRFGQRARAAVATATGAAPATAVSDVPAAAPVTLVATGPTMALSGIAVTGSTRTAILAEGQAVHLVKIGDKVRGYEIIEVTDDSVTLADASGARFVLRLR